VPHSRGVRHQGRLDWRGRRGDPADPGGLRRYRRVSTCPGCPGAGLGVGLCGPGSAHLLGKVAPPRSSVLQALPQGAGRRPRRGLLHGTTLSGKGGLAAIATPARPSPCQERLADTRRGGLRGRRPAQPQPGPEAGHARLGRDQGLGPAGVWPRFSSLSSRSSRMTPGPKGRGALVRRVTSSAGATAASPGRAARSPVRLTAP
jgi:hypothetical protein